MAKILVAEDDAMLSSLLVKRLRIEAHEVEAAYDGPQTVEKIKKWQPDLLLLDILLPVMNGFEVLEAFKNAEHSGSNMHIIILSNLSSTEDVERSKNYGVDDYLFKVNVQLEDIVHRIRSALTPNPATGSDPST